MGLQRMWPTAIGRALISLVLLDVTTTRRKASLIVVCIREALQRGSKGGGAARSCRTTLRTSCLLGGRSTDMHAGGGYGRAIFETLLYGRQSRTVVADYQSQESGVEQVHEGIHYRCCVGWTESMFVAKRRILLSYILRVDGRWPRVTMAVTSCPVL